jgi:hypothetical protein
MDKRTSKALDKSIRKWTRIVWWWGGDYGTSNCALCELFYNHQTDDVCDGCPVFLRTGSRLCYGSPYDDWMEYFQYWCVPYRVTDDKSLELAKAVLEFLKSLRE